jgi:DNA polymerase I-like protein with 3'-5' exonuclease and polymerase domains
MTEILGWPEPNTEDLYAWLKERKLPKGQMWQAPPDILGRYCALDTSATYDLYRYFETFYQRFPDLARYHREEFLTLVELTIQQNIGGLQIDRSKLIRYRTQLALDIDAAATAVLEHPDVKPCVELWNMWRAVDWWDRQPPKFNKDGKTVAKRWSNWKDREAVVTTTNHFNIKSKKHLGWLFYDNLCSVQVTKQPKTGNNKPTFWDRGEAEVTYGENKFTVHLTNKGGLPIDKSVLPQFGEVGKLLVKYNDLDKKLSFVNACLAVSSSGTLHPNFKVPGTVTGRLSGGLES